MPFRAPRIVSMVAAAALVAGLLSGLAPAPAQSAPTWTQASLASIRPGVNVSSPSGSCTSNFVFYSPAGSGFDVYIGTAAHCFGLGSATSTNGCTTGSRPLGTVTTISGASVKGTLFYSSWLAMKAANEKDGNACATNDFALVKVDPVDVAKVNPSIKYFGGPVGLRTAPTTTGEVVKSYGNSGLRFGLSPTSPKRGVSLGASSAGWSHRVYTASPGIPGDSGSGFFDSNGYAMGVLVTLQLAPYAGGNGVTDLAHALDYARAKTGKDIRLALGTEPFEDRYIP